MPTSKRPGTPEQRAAEKKAAELEKRRRNEAAKLADFNRRVEESRAVQRATKPGRLVSRARPASPTPFDPEIGRYRMARRVPGKRSPHHGMPSDAADVFGPTLACPHCGAGMLSYVGRGRYHCGTRRLNAKGLGCDGYSYGPCNDAETPYTEAERNYLENDDSLPT